jgi:hypothetical protein
VDFDGDGNLDLISGSYDPGHFYLFRGKGKGEFLARQTINDKSGKPVVTNTKMTEPVESFGTWIAMADWDNDKDLDLVLGTYDGRMLVRFNEGTRTKPAFATENVEVQADGKVLHVPGHHATPVTADWDGDGQWDILSGSDNGGVYFYRNIGKVDEPKFAAAVTLVKPHVGIGYNEFLDINEKPKPGIRSQIFVADINGDGKLDLLLGDFCTNTSPRPNLTADERKELLEARKKLEELEPELAKARAQAQEKFQAYLKTIPKEDFKKQEVQKQLRKKQEEIYKEPPMGELTKTALIHNKVMTKYLAKPKQQKFGGEDMAVSHGYVWLFIRK